MAGRARRRGSGSAGRRSPPRAATAPRGRRRRAGSRGAAAATPGKIYGIPGGAILRAAPGPVKLACGRGRVRAGRASRSAFVARRRCSSFVARRSAFAFAFVPVAAERWARPRCGASHVAGGVRARGRSRTARESRPGTGPTAPLASVDRVFCRVDGPSGGRWWRCPRAAARARGVRLAPRARASRDRPRREPGTPRARAATRWTPVRRVGSGARRLAPGGGKSKDKNGSRAQSLPPPSRRADAGAAQSVSGRGARWWGDSGSRPLSDAGARDVRDARRSPRRRAHRPRHR